MAKAPVDMPAEVTEDPVVEVPAEGSAETVKAMIVRDYWDEYLVRHSAGEVIDVTKDELIAGLVSGALTTAG